MIRVSQLKLPVEHSEEQFYQKIEKSLKILLTYVGRCDNIIKSRATRTRQAAVAQAVERRIGSAEVTGPIPVSSLEKGGSFWNAKGFCFFVFVIQLKSAAINLGR